MNFLPATSYKLPAFTLIDVLIAMTLTSFLLILLATYIRDLMQFNAFMARHQLIRSEVYPIVSRVIPMIIREAVQIDQENMREDQLALFMDRRKKKRVLIHKVSDEESSQLVLEQDGKIITLNSPKTVIENLSFEWTKGNDRSYQPMVRVKLRAHPQYFSELREKISYEGLSTLRNYSLTEPR